MKIALGLDVGEKRIGLAFGDDEVKIASPLGIIEMNEQTVFEISKIVEKFKINLLVLGLPRNSEGLETKQSEYVRFFAKKLESLGLPIVFQDESLTSVQAEEMLSKKQHFGRKKRQKKYVDDMAASIILGDYLESKHA